MKIRGSHLVSLAILAGIGGWMYTGKLIIGGQVDPDKQTIAQREKDRTTEAFRVRVEAIQPTERFKTLEVRGRTQANATVSVRAETGGTVEKRLVDKGAMVKPGDVLCTLDQGVRTAQLEQDKARLSQAEADYEATEKLLKRGFATRSQLRGFRTALDAAKSSIAKAEQDMSRTEIRATVGGLISGPMAEAGDNLAPGGVCVTLLDTDPMLFTGEVSERDIGTIKTGMKAEVKMISGESVDGKIQYIAPVADAKTRTFSIEIDIPNSDGNLRDGLTAEAHIPLAPTQAYQVDSSWLTLADDGEVGVRSVTKDNQVDFNPVKILGQGKGKLWVSGLEPNLRIITLGQNFVSVGEKVVPLSEAQMKAAEKVSDTTTAGTKKVETN